MEMQGESKTESDPRPQLIDELSGSNWNDPSSQSGAPGQKLMIQNTPSEQTDEDVLDLDDDTDDQMAQPHDQLE